MVVVAKVFFPRRHLGRAVAIYTNLEPLPADIRLDGPYFRTDEDSVHAIAFYHIPEDATPEVVGTVRQRYNGFGVLPDFVSEIQEWQEYREGLAPWVS